MKHNPEATVRAKYAAWRAVLIVVSTAISAAVMWGVVSWLVP